MKLLLWYWGRRGGGAQFTARLAEGLVENGATVLLHLSTENDEPMHTSVQVLRSPVHHPIGALRAVGPGPRSLGVEIRRFAPDLVIHPMVNPLTTFAWPSVRLLGRRRIMTVVHDPTPHFGDEHRLMDLAVRLAVKRSDLLAAPSRFSADTLQNTAARPVSVIGMGPLLAAREDSNHADHPPHSLVNPADGPLVVAGRMLPYKGLDLLADAWSKFPFRTSVPLRIVGAGQGSPSVETALSQLASLGAHVDRRWLSDDDLRQEISAARALILPYTEASQSGLVPLAHSLGVPVLASRVGGLPEQVGAGGWTDDPTSDGVLRLLYRTVASPLELSEIRTRLKEAESPASQWRRVAAELIHMVSTELADPPTDPLGIN